MLEAVVKAFQKFCYVRLGDYSQKDLEYFLKYLEEALDEEKKKEKSTRQVQAILSRSGMDGTQPKRTFQAYDQTVRTIYKSNKIMEDS